MKLKEKERDELVGRALSFLSRKFLLSLMVFIVSTVMVLTDQLDANYWLSVVAADLIQFGATNAASKKYKN
jgi:hypothetical protein